MDVPVLIPTYETRQRALLLAMVIPDHNDNYWSDDLLFHAADQVQKVRAAGEKEPLDLLSSLQGGARLRLLDAALEAENPDQPGFVPELLMALQQPGLGDDEIDLVIENLATWNLTKEERVELYTAAAYHVSREQLFNHIVSSI